MSHTWFIDLKEKIERAKFDEITKKLGIMYSPNTVGGNTYYYHVDNGNVEIHFGGVEQNQDNTPYATQISIGIFYGHEDAYQLMKNTTKALGSHIPFKNISGDWFHDIAEQDNDEEEVPIPYDDNVFSLLEK